MYTSTQTLSENLQSSQGVNQRWRLQMPFVNFKQKPILGEDHTSVVVSMREHIMPLQKVYKEDTATHARNLLTQGAWSVVVDAMKAQNKQSKAFYAGSHRLHDCVELLATGFKDKGFKRVVLMVHPSGNAHQIESLTALLRHNGLSVSHQYVGCDVFLKETLIFGESQFVTHPLELSYHLDGPKSVSDVEGNDTVFYANFKACLNHSEAVALVSWKNYIGYYR